MAAYETPRLGIYRWEFDSDEFIRTQMDDSHANIEERAAVFYDGASLPAPAAIYERSFFYNTTNSQLYFFNGVDSSGSWISLNGFIDATGNINIKDGLATTINKVTITAPATSAILTIKDGKEVVFNNGVRFSGTDNSTIQFGSGGTIAYVSDKLNIFASTTSAELAGVISDETGTGSLVFNTSPSLVTPSLGVATAASINRIQITSPATGATLTLANNSTLATSGAFSITLTATGATNVTLPTGGTLSTLANIETLTNKTLNDSSVVFANNADITKVLKFDVSGVSTGTTRTLSVPNVSGTIITTGDVGTVTNTMISSVDRTKVDNLQTWADGRYYTETEINSAYIYQWGNRPAGGAITNARQIYVQTDAPASANDGDLWFDL